MTSLVFLVTGVSSGFGHEIVLKALAQGHKAIGTVRDRNRSAEGVQAIESKGGKVIELDVTQRESCSKAWEAAEQLYGHIDVLINNAGMSYLGPFEDFTDDEWHMQMNVNVYGPSRLIRAALPSFRKRNSGTIVNISSSAGFDGLPTCTVYAASKFALEGMSEALARELEGYNISVLIVEPGAFPTKFWGSFKSNSQASLAQYPAAEKVMGAFEGGEMGKAGDPAKAAERIVEAVTGAGMAGHLKGKVQRLPLGPDCLQRLGAKIKKLSADLEAAREAGMSTNVE